MGTGLSFNATVTFSDCIFSGNSATDSGGAIRMSGSPGTQEELLLLRNCTFSGHSAAERGGALYCGSKSTELRNCILWGDSAPAGRELALGPGTQGTPVETPAATVTVAFAILEGGTGLVSLEGDAVLTTGGDILDVDPALTVDLHLTAASPAIDAGDPLFVPAVGETDIDGDPRLVGLRVDLGADEHAGGSFIFIRGDANADSLADVADAVFLLSALFLPGSPSPLCADAADTNDDGGVDVADAVALLSALFLPGTPPLPEASLACGADPTAAGLGCAATAACP